MEGWPASTQLEDGLTEKLRLDQRLVMDGLSVSRAQARDLIKRGCVRVDGAPTTKPGLVVAPDAAIEVAPDAQPYVSRGGLKLAAALRAFRFETSGIVALDVGASTGGFTDALLAAGAARVYAVDVGHGQLHPTLAADQRVMSHEGVDGRALSRDHIACDVDAVVADVSFVSLTKVLAVPLGFAKVGAWLVALVKPQFEVGRDRVGGKGIVRGEADRRAAIGKVQDWLVAEAGWRSLGWMASPIAGGSGNREYLIGARRER